MIRRILVLSLFPIAAACSTSADADVATATVDVPHNELRPELAIGDDEDGSEYEFGRISGVAVADDGRVIVADILDHALRVFSPDGEHLFRVGRQGAGPGELATPCCVAFDSERRLWVRDGGNSRYSIYQLFDDSASFVGQRNMVHSDVRRMAPVSFVGDTHIDIGMRRDQATGEARTYRFHVDHANQVVRELALHQVPADSTGMKSVQRAMEGGAATFFSYPPFAPTELYAHSPRGEYAHALSSAYAVEWRNAEGSVIHRLTNPLSQGPALNADERAAAERHIEREIERMGVGRMQLGYGVPTHKQPLRDLYFDAGGRLWIELSVEGGADRKAHVYAPDGSLQRTVQWPADISLRNGAITSNGIWGVRTDSFEVQNLVRLRGDL